MKIWAGVWWAYFFLWEACAAGMDSWETVRNQKLIRMLFYEDPSKD
jgi:hypothetical protein